MPPLALSRSVLNADWRTSCACRSDRKYHRSFSSPQQYAADHATRFNFNSSKMAPETPKLPPLGPLIRMRPLKPAELPSHLKLASLQSSGTSPPIEQFVSAILDEGHDFLANYMPAAFKVKGQNKPSPPSTAPVELLAHEVSAHDLPEEGRTMGLGETWFARTSIHDNSAKEGTASWEEFDGGLRANHSQNERDYTPEVLDAHEILIWDEKPEGGQMRAGDWTDVDLSLMEMVHKIPGPLNNRVFPLLVISARKTQEFLVVQIPVDMKTIESAKYTKDPKLTIGMYCSVERGDIIEGGAKVRWQMATASDAKGMLPMWMQKLGVPGAVIKDVGLFIGWCDKKRKGSA